MIASRWFAEAEVFEVGRQLHKNLSNYIPLERLRCYEYYFVYILAIGYRVDYTKARI